MLAAGYSNRQSLKFGLNIYGVEIVQSLPQFPRCDLGAVGERLQHAPDNAVGNDRRRAPDEGTEAAVDPRR